MISVRGVLGPDVRRWEPQDTCTTSQGLPNPRTARGEHSIGEKMGPDLGQEERTMLELVGGRGIVESWPVLELRIGCPMGLETSLS
jgi:hypothetical protein